MTLRKFVVGVAVVAVCIGFGAPLATAQESLDAPVISLGVSGYAKQTLTITAGPSGLPNGFTVWWMDAGAWAAAGSQWPGTTDPDLAYAMFSGTPTLNTFGGQYTTFELGANESIKIEIGDLADESGVDGMRHELDYGTVYYFTAFANGSSGEQSSLLSNTESGVTTDSENCTYTQGYWKTHEEAWPVSSLQLGDVVYTMQELLDILNQPVQGNGLISLAHQLIATKLNFANGADPTDAYDAVDDADALIGSLVIPPVGSGYLDPSTTSMTTQTLDDYNNGIIGPGHCPTVPAEERSWGEVKSLFQE